MTDTAARQRQLIGSTAAWAANNIVLGNGEIGIEVVSTSDVRMKVGNGSSTFSALPYASASSTTINTATQAALDAKLALSGGTMTGLLTLSGAPTASLHAATKAYVDAINTSLTTSLSGKLSTSGGTLTGLLTLSGAPTSALHAATKTYVDTAVALKVSKAGDTMTGALTLSGDPTSALHAATKQYVDSGAYQTSVGGSATYANKVVKLNASGILDSSLLPVSATYLGTVNLTAAYALSGTFTSGNYYAVSASGTIDSSWATRLTGSPTTCSAGQSIIYNGGTAKWDLVGDTTSSTAIAGKLDKAGGTMTGALILAADPTVALGAATKQYADTMLAKAGGTMTGFVTLSADPTSALHAATKQYVDNAGSTLTSAYTAADTALSSSLTTSINGKLSLSGGTMTGLLTLSGAPTAANHATTKTYVDAADALSPLRSNNLSDLSNIATARTNLGLGALATLGTVGTSQITDASVTYAKIQNVSATSRILGRKTAGAGVTEEMTLSDLLDFVGSAAQGDILYRSATGWARLPAGTSGQVLQTNGAGANPTWVNKSSGGGVVLATLSVSGLTAATFTGLNLTGYRELHVLYLNVSGTNSNARYITFEGLQVGASGTGAVTTYDGIVYVNLATGFYSTDSDVSTSSQLGNYGRCAVRNSTTSVTLGWSATNTFDAGTVTLYGIP